MTAKRIELLRISTISYGHMIRRDNFEAELKQVLDKWKYEKDSFIDRASTDGRKTILLKCYDGDVTLMEINKIIGYIEGELDENCSYDSDFEENKALRDFINISLIKL